MYIYKPKVDTDAPPSDLLLVLTLPEKRHGLLRLPEKRQVATQARHYIGFVLLAEVGGRQRHGHGFRKSAVH
jgi:hypothetical protein